MSDQRYDVVGIGNAIVDILARCDDAFLQAHNANKGAMQLVDATTIEALYRACADSETREISGGSVANTTVGLASFGSRAAFIGKVADDAFGQLFTRDIETAGVTFHTAPARGGAPTARSLVLVTPDGERTMNTFLGISPELSHGEVDASVIRDSAIVYLEGYLFDQPAAKDAFWQAAGYASDAGRRVALSLSDPFCVDRHRAEFLDLVRSRVDILFANEAEITSLYEVSSFDDAVTCARQDTRLAVLTRSGQGSVIVSPDDTIEIAARTVDTVVDATGAGDLYAAGFLHGIARELTLEACGHLGSLAASEIISHIGGRPETNLARLAQDADLV